MVVPVSLLLWYLSVCFGGTYLCAIVVPVCHGGTCLSAMAVPICLPWWYLSVCHGGTCLSAMLVPVCLLLFYLYLCTCLSTSVVPVCLLPLTCCCADGRLQPADSSRLSSGAEPPTRVSVEKTNPGNRTLDGGKKRDTLRATSLCFYIEQPQKQALLSRGNMASACLPL